MSDIVMYQTEDGLTKIEVEFENDTAWLSQSQMAELFQTTKQNISYHINNCFKEGELNENSVVKDYLTTAADGKPYNTHYYNLDVIISVGYRVKLHTADTISAKNIVYLTLYFLHSSPFTICPAP